MLCKKCGKSIPDGSEICPYCGENSQAQDSNIDSVSDEYDSIKKGTAIAVYVILGIVVIVCMATGQLAFLGCPSPVEYEIGYTSNGMLTILGWTIGLFIVRAIILGCWKSGHK